MGLNIFIINRNNVLNSDYYRDVAGCSDNEWSVYRRVTKVKRVCRHGNEWCEAITSSSRDFFVSFFIQKKKRKLFQLNTEIIFLISILMIQL